MTVKLTNAAVQHVRNMLLKRGRGIGIRLGTKKSGCSGYSYIVDYADEINEEDEVFDSNGIKVIVCSEDLVLLDGTELDYVSNNILNQGFEFKNPNMKSVCGCGESFSVT